MRRIQPKPIYLTQKRSWISLHKYKVVSVKVVNVFDYIVLVFKPMANVVLVANALIVLIQMSIKR